MTETFFTALSAIKGKALIDTMAERPGDVQIEIMDETVSQRYAQVLLKKLAYELRKVDGEGVNATVVEMNPQPLMDSGRHIRKDVGRDTWQHASEMNTKVVVWQTTSQRWTPLGEVEAKLLVNKMNKGIKVIRVKTLGQELTVV